MSRTPTLAVCAGMVIASWSICAAVYATNGGGGYDGTFFAFIILVTGILTLGSAATVVEAWRAEAGVERRVIVATVVSVLASFSVLVLALAINGRG